jgi:hypothetical protein
MKKLRAFKTELDLSSKQKTTTFVRLARLFLQLGFSGFRLIGTILVLEKSTNR